jgi:hypothetical protein
MQPAQPISDAEKQNFETLLSAVRADQICLLSTIDSREQRPAMLLCAVNYQPEADECFEFVPLAVLCDGDPYERFVPPTSTSRENES